MSGSLENVIVLNDFVVAVLNVSNVCCLGKSRKMLKGCSRRELSARRRRRQPCSANRFSIGKLKRERGLLPLPDQSKILLNLKWGAGKLCDVTPLNPHHLAAAWDPIWIVHSVAACTQASGSFLPSLLSALGPGVGEEISEAWVSILFPKAGHHCCWNLEHPVLDRTRLYVSGLTLSIHTYHA